MGQQQQQQQEGGWDVGVLRTPKGRMLAAELALWALVLGLLVAPPVPPTLALALLQGLAGAAALGARGLRAAPRLPPGYARCLDLLRAVSGALVFLAVALVALGTSRQPLAAATFTFSLALALLFAYDAYATFRADDVTAAADDVTAH